MFLSLKTKAAGGTFRMLVTFLWAFLLFVTVQPAGAQNVEIKALMSANNINCLLESGPKVFGGLNGGGLMVWDTVDPTISEVWNSSTNLSGNNITDMAFAGNNLWVSTLDAGVTRIEDAATDPHFRQYSGNLGSKRIVALTAAFVDGKEVAYYAMDGEGVGRISDGLPGFIFSTLDGMLSDNNNALQIYDGDLFVACDLGISRFHNNVFTTENSGLTNVNVNALTLDSNGNLLAGGNGGVFQWDPVAESWISLGSIGSAVTALSSRLGEIWAVGNNSLGMYDGASWTMISLPRPKISCVSAGTDLWIAGKSSNDEMSPASALVYLGRQLPDDAFDLWDIDASLVRNAEGVAMGLDGDVWIGSWLADAVSRYDGQNYSHYYEIGDADNNFSGLFNHSSNFLCMTTHPSGNIWACQFTQGILVINPETGAIQQIHYSDTAMDGGRLLNIVAHPDGTMILMHDNGEEALVDILVNPEQYEDDNNWLSLPRELPGLGNGLDVHDALVERNDVIWFAVGDVGLVRWDINGAANGPDDEITWLDTSDDRWYSPVTVLPRTSANPKSARALALAPDGTIWMGGNGVARFSFDELFGTVNETEEAWGEKTSPYTDGLVSGTVQDLAIDSNGDLWVATNNGLNRLHRTGEETSIDVFMDVENYLSNPDFGILYSSNVIYPLPSGTYKRLVASVDGSQILVSSDRGAALLKISESSGGEDDATLDNLYCYPNPFVLEKAEFGLSLAGLTGGSSGDVAAIEIFNIEGQLVYSNSAVSPNSPFWSGVNRLGNLVASGMYVVKVVWQNTTAICPLTVVQ